MGSWPVHESNHPRRYNSRYSSIDRFDSSDVPTCVPHRWHTWIDEVGSRSRPPCRWFSLGPTTIIISATIHGTTFQTRTPPSQNSSEFGDGVPTWQRREHDHGFDTTRCQPSTQCVHTAPSGHLSSTLRFVEALGPNPWMQPIDPGWSRTDPHTICHPARRCARAFHPSTMSIYQPTATTRAVPNQRFGRTQLEPVHRLSLQL